MRFNSKSLAPIAIVLALAGLFIMRAFIQSRTEQARTEQKHGATSPTSSQPGTRPTNAELQSRTGADVPDNDVQGYLRAAESVREKVKREQVPLDFYGRVVDEDGAGVPNTRIVFSYSHFDPLQPFYLFYGTSELSLMSDNAGNFAVRGIQGYGFSVKVSKEGYDASTSNFRGASIVGGPDRPVKTSQDSPMIFHLRKKGLAEPLIYVDRSYRLARDGSPKLIDLLTGRTNTPNADLRIQAWTDEQHKDKEYRYDFRVRIEVTAVIEIPFGVTSNYSRFWA
jgi:hypothetical protein